MRISPSSRKDRATEGEIINYMQVDSQRLVAIMLSSPDLFSIPIVLSIYIYLLFRFFGYAFLVGFGVLAIFLFFNWLIQRKFREYTKVILKLRDNRMKVITETFNSLKILKLYSWENQYYHKVNYLIKKIR